MTLPRTVADVLDRHVTFETESIDRMYCNVYQPRLQYPKGAAAFFHFHRGHAFASSALMAPTTKAFVAEIHNYVAARGLDWSTSPRGSARTTLPSPTWLTTTAVKRSSTWAGHRRRPASCARNAATTSAQVPRMRGW